MTPACGRAVNLGEGGAACATVVAQPIGGERVQLTVPEEVAGASELKLDECRGGRAGGGVDKGIPGSCVVCAPFSSQLTRNCRRHC